MKTRKEIIDESVDALTACYDYYADYETLMRLGCNRETRRLFGIEL